MLKFTAVVLLVLSPIAAQESGEVCLFIVYGLLLIATASLLTYLYLYWKDRR